MPNSKDYAQLVAAAEKAVLAVKDAELRRSAFQIVLEDLLGGGSGMSRHVSAKVESTQSRQSSSRPAKTRKARGGTQSYVDELLSEGFFKERRSISDVKAELENRGHHIPLSSLSGPLQRMCKERRLRRQKTAETGSRSTYSYSNW